MKDKNTQIADNITSIQHVCCINYLKETNDNYVGNDRVIDWELWFPASFRSLSSINVSGQRTLFILYFSGTTGKPKCIVHSVGGTTLNHLKEHQPYCDGSHATGYFITPPVVG